MIQRFENGGTMAAGALQADQVDSRMSRNKTPNGGNTNSPAEDPEASPRSPLPVWPNPDPAQERHEWDEGRFNGRIIALVTVCLIGLVIIPVALLQYNRPLSSQELIEADPWHAENLARQQARFRQRYTHAVQYDYAVKLIYRDEQDSSDEATRSIVVKNLREIFFITPRFTDGCGTTFWLETITPDHLVVGYETFEKPTCGRQDRYDRGTFEFPVTHRAVEVELLERDLP